LRDSKLSRPDSAVKESRTKRKESKLFSQIKKSLSWRYQFSNAAALPAKQSVTQLTHRNDEYVKFDYSKVLERKPRAVIATEAGLIEPQGRLIGTAAHLVISQLDLSKPVTAEAIEKTKEKLLADSAVAENVAEHIDAQSILSFFESDLGKMAAGVWPNVWREWPFTFALAACDISDETIVVQGIIDMLVQTPERLIIIDFKTDNVTAAEVTGRAEFYRRQLELYGRAASAILKSKLLAKWLYFLTPGCAIEV
jgi:ATP-dependent helicase/nuclease subunit A